MPRFFLDDDFQYDLQSPLPESITLCGEDAFHLSVSLRARIGDAVELCTADGIEILCSIAEISGGKKDPKVTLTPESAAKSAAENKNFFIVLTIKLKC